MKHYPSRTAILAGKLEWPSWKASDHPGAGSVDEGFVAFECFQARGWWLVALVDKLGAIHAAIAAIGLDCELRS